MSSRWRLLEEQWPIHSAALTSPERLLLTSSGYDGLVFGSPPHPSSTEQFYVQTSLPKSFLHLCWSKCTQEWKFVPVFLPFSTNVCILLCFETCTGPMSVPACTADWASPWRTGELSDSCPGFLTPLEAYGRRFFPTKVILHFSFKRTWL